ncbi:MAG TPA: methylated-DNA--[protein]-cysteine S-methyltransferase [Candidatus Elarobacter sp.]|jgi:methylated-DNA-[protein]-cysteine S-methyltransferase
MHADGFTIFATPIGPCAVAWRGPTIVGSQLPERDEAALRNRMQRRFPGVPEASPPHDIATVVERIRHVVRGDRPDPANRANLDDVAVDMTDVPDFNRSVYEIARSIPPGSTLSYGDIAAQLGDKTLSRAVGQALGANPFAPIVPCHRVVAADGKMHGFSASGGLELKLRMLRNEGWRANEPTLFD